MAQLQPEKDVSAATDAQKISQDTKLGSSSSAVTNFKFNVQAPEFVPRSLAQVPASGYFYPYLQYQDWIYVGDQDPPPLYSNLNLAASQSHKNSIPDEVKHKIIKQVEYQLSDMSLLANENLAKQMSKDPEGYVPITSVASTKKIKSLLSNTSSNHVLAQALQSSTKLTVSSDGKKVKRKHPFTDKDKEELQCRTVVAENLPDDHSHHNIEKIFNVVGSVKTIRICHPQDPNSSSRSKGEYFISHKLHALIEFESLEIAEKAVEKLNDERNWRKGLRVKLLLRRSPRSVLKNRKSEFDGCLDEDDQGSPHETAEDSFPAESADTNAEVEESSSAANSKKGWGKGRGKTRARVQTNGSGGGGRGLLQCSSSSVQSESPAKVQVSKGPRMPDGTRGFTMGRGKPLTTVPCI